MPSIGSWYFAWVDDSAVFDPTVHNVQDERPIFIARRHREGQAARLTVEILAPDSGLLEASREQRAFISVELDGVVTLFADGRLDAVPAVITERSVQLAFICRPPGADSKLQALLDGAKSRPHWDPWYIPAGREDDPGEVLAGRSERVYWPADGGDPQLSDILSGSAGTVDLGGAFDRDSLSVSSDGETIADVELEITARWKQRDSAEIDIGTRLAESFEAGVPNTLTPEQLEADWPSGGDEPGGESGYRLIDSRLERIEPPGGTLGKKVITVSTAVIPTVAPVVRDAGAREVAFERRWYSASARYRAVREQTRTETLTGTLTAGLQERTRGSGQTKQVTADLSDVDDPDTPIWLLRTDYTEGDRVRFGSRLYEAQQDHTSGLTFGADLEVGLWDLVGSSDAIDSAAASVFLTTRGEQAAQHAMLRARALLRRAARSQAITVEGRIQDLIGVTLDHDMRVADSRLPGGEVTGKVIETDLTWDLDGGRVSGQVTIGAAVGTGGSASADSGQTQIEDVVYDDYDAQTPVEPVGEMTEDSLVMAAEVTDDGAAQAQALDDLPESGGAKTEDPEAALGGRPTRVRMDLRPLAATGEIAHEIQVSFDELPIPRQLDLEAT